MTHYAVLRRTGRAILATVCGRVMIYEHPLVRSDFAYQAMGLPYGHVNVFRRNDRRFRLMPRGWTSECERVSVTAHRRQPSLPDNSNRLTSQVRHGMPRFVIKLHKAVWETTTVEIDAPDLAHVEAHRDELIATGLDDGTADIATGDAVEGVADEYEVYDERGTCLAGTGATAALLVERS